MTSGIITKVIDLGDRLWIGVDNGESVVVSLHHNRATGSEREVAKGRFAWWFQKGDWFYCTAHHNEERPLFDSKVIEVSTPQPSQRTICTTWLGYWVGLAVRWTKRLCYGCPDAWEEVFLVFLSLALVGMLFLAP